MSNLYFPLVLSCGHLASGNCECWRGAHSGGSEDSPFTQAALKCDGNWRGIIEGYGAKLPSGRRHGPCPVCAGKDRFRFDDKDGRGTYFCSHCGAGSGLSLLALYLAKPAIDVAKELIGDDPRRTIAPAREHKQTDEQIRAENNKRAARGATLMLSQAIRRPHPYMDAKGLSGEWLVNGEIMMGPDGERIEPGDMLLVPAFKGGELVNIQKIKSSAHKRPITGGDMHGVCHCIEGEAKIVAVVEGYATGVTVNRMTLARTYVAFNTANLSSITAQAKEENPGKTIVIFADHDDIDEKHGWRPGTKYAEDAAVPSGAKIALPPELGDWDDYRQRHGEKVCKQAMRDAIRLDGKPAPVKEKSEMMTKAESLVESSAKLVADIKDNEHPAPSPAPAPAPAVMGGFFFPGFEPLAPAPEKPKETSEEYSHKGEVPKGMDLSDMDVDYPPGLAGRIVDYIRAGAQRELTGGAYSVMALQCIAIAASGLKGFSGGKTSLITIILALSGAGKDRAQEVISDILTEAGRRVYGDIRSDKDVIMTVMQERGRCAYIIDEAHKFLIQPKGGSSYAANISTTLMELATSKNFKPARNHVAEVETTLRNSLSRLEKEKLALEDAIASCNPEHDKEKISQYQRQLSRKEERIASDESAIHMLETGIPNPCLNLAGSSTPAKLSAMVSSDNIDSGLLARAILVDCGESRSRKRREMVGVDASTLNPLARMEIIRDISLIASDADRASVGDVEREFSGDGEPVLSVIATDEAIEMIKLINDHYDQDRYRNHDQIGSMYARISERVQMLASLMAFGNVIDGKAVIEPVFVRWSLTLIIKSFDNLISNLKLNAAIDGDDVADKISAIQEKIMRRLESAKGEQVFIASVKQSITKASYYKEIKKALEGTGQDAFQNALVMLQSQGKIVTEGKTIRVV